MPLKLLSQITGPSPPSKTTRKRPADSNSASRKPKSSKMSYDSMDDPSTALWIASLRAGRANPIPLPENDTESPTNGGSGETSPASLASAEPHYFSEKTSPGSSATPIAKLRTTITDGTTAQTWTTTQIGLWAEWEPFSGIWPKWGLCRNGEVFELPKWEPAMGARESSFWPTADAQVMNDGADISAHRSRQDRLKETHHNGNGAGTPLAIAAVDWATPNAHDATGARGKGFELTDCHYYPHDLNAQTEQWMTPNVPNGGRKMSEADTKAKGATDRGKRQVYLESQAEFWASPQARDYRSGETLQDYGNSRPLSEQAPMWNTPVKENSEDAGSAKRPDLVRQANMWLSPHGLQLLPGDPGGGGEFAEHACRFSLPVPLIPAGLTFYERVRILLPLCRQLRKCLRSPYSKAGRFENGKWQRAAMFKRKLSPEFTEWLMSWDIGWTDDAIAFSAAETASSVSRRQSYCVSLLGGLE